MDIRAEILTIGDEILWGQITDTNSQFISAQLTDIGICTVRKTSVGDTAEAITEALDQALSRAQVVLITGGLGPTKDDITKKTLSTYFRSELKEHPQAWEDLQAWFAQRQRPINDLNRLQATLPDIAEYIRNERGTAPGMWFQSQHGKVVVSMPGVPSEMRYMVQTYVLPKLKATFQTPVILHRFIQTVGIGESDLAIKIEAWEDALPTHVKLAYLPSRAKVTLRLTGTGEDAEALAQELDHLADEGAKLIPVFVYSRQNQELEQALADLFVQQKLTLSAAESCTGGAFASRITAQEGASIFFQGSAVVYSAAAKKALGVDPAIIDQFTVYSEECAKAMAEAARRFYGTDLAVASTGVAGPAADGDVQPGTIYIAVAGPTGSQARLLHLSTDRTTNIELTVTYMLDMLRKQIPETQPSLTT